MPSIFGPSGASRPRAGPGQVLFDFVRHWSRRFAAGDPGFVEQGRLVLATEAGYLAVRASATDRSRRELTLTPAGKTMVDQAHRWQEEIFLRLSAGWPESRRDEFRQAMTDLMERSHDLEA